mmetsp:Transcript_13065/g.15594  ORF Transcript_13065/g.15594 Transcript_13065/m.15594 type:complete len:365 (+) Transcript_13065:60-1154(+)
MPALPPVSGVDERFEEDFSGHPDTSQYAKFTTSEQRRDELKARFDNHFDLPLQDHAAEHQIYMETTVKDFKKKIAHLERLLRSEKARRSQIGMTFRSFFKDTMIEIQQYGNEQRATTNAHINDRFQDIKRRLEELSERIPREQNELIDNITENTEAIRKQVDHFLSVDCANESTGCKSRHQSLVDAIGTSAMHVEDEMNVAQKERQNSMDELRDMLRESSQLATKNANRLRGKLEYDLASIKNALTTETIMRELSDTELAMMMSKQIGYLMQSAKCVNSNIGIEEVDAIDYASEKTLRIRQEKLEIKLRLHLEQEKIKALEAMEGDGGINEMSEAMNKSPGRSRTRGFEETGKRTRRPNSIATK